MADDNDIHAGLRELVDDGGPAASDEALRDVLRRGRKKRMHKRLGAVASVVAVVTGVGVAMATVPELGAPTPRPITPAGPELRQPVPQATSGPQRTRTPATSAAATPSHEQAVACPPGALPLGKIPLSAGVRICPTYEGASKIYYQFSDIVRSALSRTSATVQPSKGGSIAKVSGAGYVGNVSLNPRGYLGVPKPDAWPDDSDAPLIVRRGEANTRSNLEQNIPEPVVLMYFPDGRLYVVRGHPPDPLPAPVLSKIVDELAEVGRR